MAETRNTMAEVSCVGRKILTCRNGPTVHNGIQSEQRKHTQKATSRHHLFIPHGWNIAALFKVRSEMPAGPASWRYFSFCNDEYATETEMEPHDSPSRGMIRAVQRPGNQLLSSSYTDRPMKKMVQEVTYQLAPPT